MLLDLKKLQHLFYKTIDTIASSGIVKSCSPKCIKDVIILGAFSPRCSLYLAVSEKVNTAHSVMEMMLTGPVQ